MEYGNYRYLTKVKEKLAVCGLQCIKKGRETGSYLVLRFFHYLWP